MNLIKSTIKELLIFFHLDLTKNIRYDRLTREIFRRQLKDEWNCIDVGCHKGEILDMMLKYSPSGKHYAFEPIPYLFKGLKEKFESKAMVFPYALADSNGRTTFQLVENAPAYSGIKKRKYDIDNPIVQEIEVDLKKLDDVVPSSQKIHLIKIDVEGAELGVLKGARELLKSNKPIVVFECGKGASDFYGTTPGEVFDFFLNEIGMSVYTLEAFIQNKQAFSKVDFENAYETEQEYYFVAASR